ncbi:hypothetical protein QYH69_35920, partial [Paraburkholderia sp. SARCC-3016]|uniref:hypothetical protein n=1 Tax=Paraburkholderia sp. SARCC-3016 TaxID=3058611 RepID=UPI00280728D2
MLARLSKEDANDYAKAKATLFRKYTFSTQGFRQKFRSSVIKAGESYPEFAYNVKATMVEWLKSASVYDDRDKVLECFCLEQFYRGIPDKVQFWVQDRTDVKTVEQAAELAQDYVMRREARGQDRQGKAYRESDKSFGKKRHFGKSESGKGMGNFPKGKDSAETVPKEVEGHNPSKEAKEAKAKRAFETRRQSVCYNCNEPGHFAANCPKPKVVFSYVSEDDENIALLSPYMRELEVNRKPSRRPSGLRKTKSRVNSLAHRTTWLR